MTIQMFDYSGGTGTYPLGTGEYDILCFLGSCKLPIIASAFHTVVTKTVFEKIF